MPILLRPLVCSAILMAKRKQEDNRDLIIKLWETPTFHGSFTGPSTFGQALKQEGIVISDGDLRDILHSIPAYVNRIRKAKIPETIPYRVGGYNLLWEVDLAQMSLKSGNKYRYFMLCVDVFSRKIWTSLMERKNRKAIEDAFNDVFKQSGSLPEKIQGDYDFQYFQEFMREKKIYLRTVFRRGKAIIAEYQIYLLKRRLYHFMAHFDRQDWWTILKQTTENVNNTPRSLLGGLMPSQITGPEFDPLVRQLNPNRPQPLGWDEQRANLEKYNKSKKKFKIGDLVLYDMETKELKKGPAFTKSYSEKVSFPSFIPEMSSNCVVSV